MSAVEGDYPKVSIGTLAHQGFAWVAIERSRGQFDFKAFDGYMTSVQQHGLIDPVTNTAEMAMTLAAATPGWAVSDQTSCSSGSAGLVSCTAAPDNIQDWKDFLTAVVQHYNGKTQPHIRYYELWNEFNVSLWWTGTDAQMVALAQAAYPIIHQDPNSLLLTPSVAGPVGTTSPNSGVIWMTRYLQAGGSRYADGGAFHGYIGAQSGVNPFPMPEEDSTAGCKTFVGCYGSIITKATQMRAVFDQNGLAGKPMFQTEGSWGNSTITDLDTQIAWLARWNLLQAGLYSTLDLRMAAWFTWGGGTTFGWGDIETASLDPTAAGLAYSQVYTWVVGATISQPCSGGTDGTWTCTLTRPGGYVAQAVWNTKGSLAYKPGAGYTQFRDLAGNATPIVAGSPVQIGAKPILVEGTPVGGPPVITLAANAFGDIPLIAPNTWVEIKGLNLGPAGDIRIWQGSDFVNNQMPTQLDGISATVNGKNAFLYYISPTQVNILTPPDPILGPVQVQLTDNGVASSKASVSSAALSLSFFAFVSNGKQYAYGRHLDSRGTLVGPPNLLTGVTTTPVKPGETISLAANGFGLTSTAVISGSISQGGSLPTLPVVSIGGMQATVRFAGLVSPGNYLFNVDVPASLPDGDQPISATYNGLTSQPGVLLTVQH